MDGRALRERRDAPSDLGTAERDPRARSRARAEEVAPVPHRGARRGGSSGDLRPAPRLRSRRDAASQADAEDRPEASLTLDARLTVAILRLAGPVPLRLALDFDTAAAVGREDVDADGEQNRPDRGQVG